MSNAYDAQAKELIAQQNEKVRAEVLAGMERKAAGGQPNIISVRDECAGDVQKSVKVALSGSAAETLRCLFFHGPTWDGNVPSKSGRDELVNMGLAARGNGWQWLTRAGIDACFSNGIHDEKDARESRERKRRIRIEEAARSILG